MYGSTVNGLFDNETSDLDLTVNTDSHCTSLQILESIKRRLNSQMNKQKHRKNHFGSGITNLDRPHNPHEMTAGYILDFKYVIIYYEGDNQRKL